jgi:3,4-dihydroxy-2-butanone 4-phosphate synthase
MTHIASPVVPDRVIGDGPTIVRGEVVHGDARGRTLGFPTANVRLHDGAVPVFGVYAGRLDGAPAAISVGVRPTFGSELEPLLEAHVLDYEGDLYGRQVEIELLRFVREERPFGEVDELVAQMHADVRRVRQLLAEDEADARTRVASAVEALRGGRMVVLSGGETARSADLVVAAVHADADAVNRLAHEARGIVSLVLPGARCDRLGLSLLRDGVHGAGRRAYTVSIEAREGVSTGISAGDRAATIAVAVSPRTGPHDVVVPGHVFPVRAADGGVLERADQPEGALDLVRLGALQPGAVVCTMLDEDGDVAGPATIAAYAERHGLLTVTVEDLVTYRRSIERGAGGCGVVDLGEVRAVAFEGGEGGRVALVMGDVAGRSDVPIQLVDGTDGALASALSLLKLDGGGIVLTPPSGPFDARVAGRVAAGFASLGVRGVRVAGDPRLAAVDALLGRLPA